MKKILQKFNVFVFLLFYILIYAHDTNPLCLNYYKETTFPVNKKYNNYNQPLQGDFISVDDTVKSGEIMIVNLTIDNKNVKYASVTLVYRMYLNSGESFLRTVVLNPNERISNNGFNTFPVKAKIPQGIKTDDARIIIENTDDDVSSRFSLVSDSFTITSSDMPNMHSVSAKVSGTQKKQLTVTWSTNKPSNTETVGIKMYYTFRNRSGVLIPKTLTIAPKTPNDGSHTYELPNFVKTENAQIVVDGFFQTSGNLFSSLMFSAPFKVDEIWKVTDQKKWYAGSKQLIKWSGGPINKNGEKVNIKLVYFNNNLGKYITKTIALNRPNTGKFIYTVPDGINSKDAEIFIEASNREWDMTSNIFTISPFKGFALINVPKDINSSNAQNTSFEFRYIAKSGFTNFTKFTASGLPNNTVATFSPKRLKRSGTVRVTISKIPGFSGEIKEGYGINVIATSGIKTISRQISLMVTFNNSSKLKNSKELKLSETASNKISIRPNPNQGVFSITSNNIMAKNLTARVYDVSGRLVFKQDYKGSKDFTETIQLQDAKSGLHILVLNNGLEKVVKKIVVE